MKEKIAPANVVNLYSVTSVTPIRERGNNWNFTRDSAVPIRYKGS